MVTNQWVALENDDDNVDTDYRWYYFGSDGKAYRNKSNDAKITKSNIKTINGKKYTFDEDGRMLFGWVHENELEPITDFDETSWADESQKSYYFGGADDGSAQSGWFQLAVSHPNDDDDVETYWFWGDSNGKIQKDGSKTISGVKYYFDVYGAMVEGFVDTSSNNTAEAGATASEIVYVNGDGGSRKNQWIWAVPDEDWLEADYNDDEYSWFFAKSNGKLLANQVKKINSKYYAFDVSGRMLYGIVAQTDNGWARLSEDDYNGTAFANGDLYNEAMWRYNSPAASKVAYDYDEKDIYYYSNDEKADGARKTGYVNVEFEDDTYQMYFNTSSGKAENGYVSKIKKFVRNGVVLKANSDENSLGGVLVSNSDASKPTLLSGEVYYDAELSDYETNEYVLVNTSGTVQKNAKNKKDTNDSYYWTDKNGRIIYYGEKLEKKTSSSTNTDVKLTYKGVEYVIAD